MEFTVARWLNSEGSGLELRFAPETQLITLRSLGFGQPIDVILDTTHAKEIGELLYAVGSGVSQGVEPPRLDSLEPSARLN